MCIVWMGCGHASRSGVGVVLMVDELRERSERIGVKEGVGFVVGWK